MRSPWISLAALACLTALPAVSRADTFNFSAGGSGGGFLGSGTITATNNGDGSFSITAITGTGVTGLSTFNGADNLLFPNNSRLVSVNGFSFTDTLYGTPLSVNLYSTAGAGYRVTTLDNEGDFADNAATFSLASSAVPEPSSLVLLGTGVLAAAGAVRRRLTR